jgi:hypothetical protein
MGAYGGTAQASMSPNSIGSIADIDHNDIANLDDLYLWSEDWLLQQHLLDTDLNRNGSVDFNDFQIFQNNW